MPRFLPPIAVFAGGVLGTWVRWMVFHAGETTALFIVNTVGTLILAALTAALKNAPEPWGPLLKLFVGTGLCGALTTQSTFALVVVQSGASGAFFTLMSLLAGICAAVAGWFVGSAFNRTPRSQSC